jgi:hypothetical protein
MHSLYIHNDSFAFFAARQIHINVKWYWGHIIFPGMQPPSDFRILLVILECLNPVPIIEHNRNMRPEA